MASILEVNQSVENIRDLARIALAQSDPNARLARLTEIFSECVRIQPDLDELCQWERQLQERWQRTPKFVPVESP